MQESGLTAPPVPDDTPDESNTEVYDTAEYEYDLDVAKRTWPRTTLVLLVGVLMAVAFTGGVLVQKNHDKGLTAAATGLPAGFTPGAFPGAGSGGLGGVPGGGTGATGNAATTGPVLVGTVVSVSGPTVTVKDFGGATHQVSTTGTTTVTKQELKKLTDLAAGDTVSVNGKRATDGNVAATALTIR
ncbi:MAG: hypothetical protein ABI438_02020 [Dermatophilaceae bacterium]